MAKPKSPTKKEKANETSGKDRNVKQSSSGIKIAIFTTIITALVGFIGTVTTVYIQDVYRPSLWARQTQTAEAVNQPGLTQTAEAIIQQDTCPPAPKEPSPTEVAILREYINVDEAGVYSEKDQSIKPFQILYRGDSVEVLNNSDRVWACITYARDDVRIYGYILRDQLIYSFALTETAVVSDASATATASP